MEVTQINLLDNFKQGDISIKLFKRNGEECDFSNYKEMEMILNEDGKGQCTWKHAGGSVNNYIARAVVYIRPYPYYEEASALDVTTDGSDLIIIYDEIIIANMTGDKNEN